MRLAAVLEKARPALAARWAEAADAVYPFAAAGFLRSRRDPFANPVGQRSRELSETLLDAVIGVPHDGKALRAALEEFVRVRAMQDMPPETSLQVMFAYKDIIRVYLKEHAITPDEPMREDLRAMDERCDTLALLAFGGYTRARETFHNARIEDVRRRHSQVMRLAKRRGLIISDDGFNGLSEEDAAGSPAGGNPADGAGRP